MRQTSLLFPLFCIWFTLPICFVTTPPLFALEGWAATYGGVGIDRAHSIRQTMDGGYIVTGETGTFGDKEFPDIWVLKLKADGTVEWQKTYGGDRRDVALSIQQTGDGGYVAAGWTDSFGAGLGDWDSWVLKLRSDGTVEWQKTYGGDKGDEEEEALSIKQTSEGGYIVAGSTGSFGVGSSDIWVLKLRVDGSIEWQKTYGGIEWDEADSIQQTSDGGYIVAGDTGSFGPIFEESSDIWILKLRADGTVEWQKTYGREYDDGARSVQQTRDGGYIVAGLITPFRNEDDWIMDFWVLKLRADGSIDWQKRYGGDYWQNADSIQQTSDGGYVVAGWTTSFGRGFDAWVLKLTPDGSVEWQKTYGGGGSDDANSIQQTSDGGYIVAGGTESFGAGEADLWVLKLRPDGSIDPSCDLVRATKISSGKDSDVAVKSPRIIPFDSRANLQCPTFRSRITNVLANILCPQAASGGD